MIGLLRKIFFFSVPARPGLLGPERLAFRIIKIWSCDLLFNWLVTDCLQTLALCQLLIGHHIRYLLHLLFAVLPGGRGSGHRHETVSRLLRQRQWPNLSLVGDKWVECDEERLRRYLRPVSKIYLSHPWLGWRLAWWPGVASSCPSWWPSGGAWSAWGSGSRKRRHRQCSWIYFMQANLPTQIHPPPRKFDSDALVDARLQEVGRPA